MTTLTEAESCALITQAIERVRDLLLTQNLDGAEYADLFGNAGSNLCALYCLSQDDNDVALAQIVRAIQTSIEVNRQKFRDDEVRAVTQAIFEAAKQ